MARLALAAAALLCATMCRVSAFSPAGGVRLRPSLRPATCDVSMAKAKKAGAGGGGGGFGTGTKTLEKKPKKDVEAKKEANRVGGKSIKKKGGDDLFALIDNAVKAPSTTTVSPSQLAPS
jgi:hypothetical protein